MFARMRILRPIPMLLTGLALCLAAIVYGVVTVGVPGPDATPQMIARENFHLTIIGWLFWTGAALALSGVLWGLLRRFVLKRR